MKLKSLFIFSALSGVCAGAANAGTVADIYAGATVGAGGATVFADYGDKSFSSQVYGAMIGIDIPVLRLEGEYNYLYNQDLKMQLAMANAYFKMPSTVVHPYLGLGLGSAFNGKFMGQDTDSAAAYQGMFGATFDVPGAAIKVDLEARVLYTPDFIESVNETPDALQYNARVKLRFVF